MSDEARNSKAVNPRNSPQHSGSGRKHQQMADSSRVIAEKSKAEVGLEYWFENEFGFRERSAFGFEKVQDAFEVEQTEEGVALHSKHNNKSFHVGRFETPSVIDLRRRLQTARQHAEEEAQDQSEESSLARTVKGIRFKNIAGDARQLHLSHENAGSIFQVASQFNCLEMVSPQRRPEQGVSDYYLDTTQGPACAMACPAATVFRNYFCAGPRVEANTWSTGQLQQIDTMCDVAALLDNDTHEYWRMQNGYLLPRPGAMRELGKRFKRELTANSERGEGTTDRTEECDGLAARVTGAVRIGVQWDTETAKPARSEEEKDDDEATAAGTGGGGQRVCQVLSSALPMAYVPSTPTTDWQELAMPVLEAQYEGALLVAAILSRQRRERVRVFLTCVGGGEFGNPSPWIQRAIARALAGLREESLDVLLVHLSRLDARYAFLDAAYDPVP